MFHVQIKALMVRNEENDASLLRSSVSRGGSGGEWVGGRGGAEGANHLSSLRRVNHPKDELARPYQH
jgi:hypothetical protein